MQFYLQLGRQAATVTLIVMWVQSDMGSKKLIETFKQIFVHTIECSLSLSLLHSVDAFDPHHLLGKLCTHRDIIELRIRLSRINSSIAIWSRRKSSARIVVLVFCCCIICFIVVYYYCSNNYLPFFCYHLTIF